MTADASFGNIWKATLTSASDVGFSEYKFDRYQPCWLDGELGVGQLAVKNLSLAAWPTGQASRSADSTASATPSRWQRITPCADGNGRGPAGITGVSDDHASPG